MDFRTGGDRWGGHRVVSPKGVLPQTALALDPSLPLFDNEVLIHVQSLQIDSASFHQLLGERGVGSIREQILSIVRDRGKMHNPVTNSGGVFLGEVEAIGPKNPLREDLKIGDKIVSLVSLTLTPLHLESISAIDEAKERVFCDGHALLFESGLAMKLPDDFSEGTTLAALDVCGASAQVKRWVRSGQKVLVLGLGKAGRASAAQAELAGALVLGVDPSSEAVGWARDHLKGHFEKIDARDPLAVYAWVEKMTRGALADMVIQMVPIEGTEMTAILSCREGGKVIFFGMRTEFGKAVLGAEGIGKDVVLLMGSGYVPGHAELMFHLLRSHAPLRKWFEEKYGKDL